MPLHGTSTGSSTSGALAKLNASLASRSVEWLTQQQPFAAPVPREARAMLGPRAQLGSR